MIEFNPEGYWFDKVGTIRHLLDAIESLQKAQAITVSRLDQKCLTLNLSREISCIYALIYDMSNTQNKN